MLVNLDVYVEHANLSEEFWELFLCRHVILLDQIFLNLFLDLLLRLRVVRVCVHQPCHLFLILLFLLHLGLEFIANDFFKFLSVTGLEGCSQLWIVLLQEGSLVRIVCPDLLDLVYFLSDPLIQLIMIQRIEHLIEIHLRCSLDLLHVLVERPEEVA